MIARILAVGNDQVEVVQAGGGQEALDLLKAERFDLVILDFMMPEVSGLDVLKALRTRVGAGELPVIMLTARSEEPNVMRSLELGASYFIKKPFEPQELLDTVESVLGISMQP